ncbi:MAG: 2-oxo acid dehydrogenase subunit E2, partial [Leuconostoc falkenbergense]
TVAMDDPVAEVQNDKLIQEILSPYAGTVTKLFVDAGTTVSVGDSLIEFDGDGSGNSGDESAEPTANDTVEDTSVDTTTSVTPQTPTATELPQVVNGHVLAMPSVRHLAFEKGIDLTKVPATGRHGHVTLADVTAYQATDTPVAAISSEASNETTATAAVTKDVEVAEPVREGRQPMSGVRKAIAKAMATQNATIPTVTNFDSVEVSKLVAHRQTFKTQLADQDIHLTYLAYAVKALAATAKKFPEINASLDMDTQEVVYHDDVNMGIAVNAPSGLYVPVIKRADQKSIVTIAKEIAELATAVREGTIKPAQMQGGTVTISNLGSARGTWFTPIINGKEVAILGLGSILKEPIVGSDGELAVGQNMKLSLSYDHRLIDGMLGQSAINYLKQLLADPAYMLMEV